MNFFTSIFFLCFSCTSSSNTERIYKTTHFKIFYTKLDDKRIKEISDSLENNYARIITNLHSENLSITNVHFYTDITGLQQAVKLSAPNLPTWAVGLATNVSEIHMLSPNHPDQDYETMLRNTIHEFAHCVSLNINTTIGNNPRWLWEVVAIYQANQKRNPHELSYLENQNPPTLDELNQLSNTYIYEVGYLVGDFIVATKGTTVLNKLIKNNGNLKETLNINDEQFTEQWFAYVKKKYGI